MAESDTASLKVNLPTKEQAQTERDIQQPAAAAAAETMRLVSTACVCERTTFQETLLAIQVADGCTNPLGVG